MRAVVFKKELYVSVRDLVETGLPMEELIEQLKEDYKDTGSVRRVTFFNRRKRAAILQEYLGLIQFWDKESAMLRVCQKYKVKKTQLKQWARSIKNE